MNQLSFFVFWLAVFLGQLALCIFSKRAVIKLIPLFLLLTLAAVCIGIYLATQNWAYLIMLLIIFLGFLVDGAVWVFYGIIKLMKIIAGLSRKNT